MVTLREPPMEFTNSAGPSGGELSLRRGYRIQHKKDRHTGVGWHPLPRRDMSTTTPPTSCPPLRQRRGFHITMGILLSPLLARRGAGHMPGRVVVLWIATLCLQCQETKIVIPGLDHGIQVINVVRQRRTHSLHFEL